MSETVEISIRMDELKVDTRNWNAVVHDGWRGATEQTAVDTSVFSEDTCADLHTDKIKVTWGDSSLQIDVSTKYNENRLVAHRFVAEGYRVPLPVTKKRKWVDSFEVNHDVPSAQMCVNGQVHMPEQMNFFFPVDVTTPDGFTMKLLLGQSSVGKGLKATVKDLYTAGKAATKAYAAAEAGDEDVAIKQVAKYDYNLIKVFEKSHMWHVLAMGTREYPCSVLYYGDGHQESTRLLCIGTTAKDEVQSACFHVLPGHPTNQFGLRIHRPKPR